MKCFITGIAGMIGAHLAKKLIEEGHEVSGIDNFNSYYDPQLKRDRVKALIPNVYVPEFDLKNIGSWYFNSNKDKPDLVIHLAAYANPRHSLIDPYSYIETNIQGTQKLIDACEKAGIDDVIYASSSCVMHGQPLPWNETDLPELPNNMYGISKRANEAQFQNSKIKRKQGLRFFTVYGEWGRPDMALFLFTDAIIHGKSFKVYNHGDMRRDFTYVGDIVSGISSLIESNNSKRSKHYAGEYNVQHSWNEIYNIGYGERVDLMDFVGYISSEVGKDPIIEYVDKHPSDVLETWSDTTKLQTYANWKPETSIEDGVKKFVSWYRDYYNV